jgi:hypothetical protein
LSLPSYEEFRQALADPARRAQIGLVITDNDAQSLAGNEEWARNYFDSWIAMAAPAPTAVMPEAPQAPATPSPFSSAPTEQFSAPAAPAAPAAPFGQPAGYAPAGYQAAPQQGYAAPQQGQPFGAQPGSQNMPQGQMPKKGLPGWALGVIIGGAALVLLGGIGVTALVLTAGNNDKDTASSSQESDDSSTTAPDDADTDPSEEPFEEPFDPEAEDPDDLFGDFDLDYSEADAASYLAIAAPIYGLEASEYMDQDLIDDTMLTGGEAACVSLETGYSEADLVESLTAADLSSSDAQALVDAAKQYLCN